MSFSWQGRGLRRPRDVLPGEAAEPRRSTRAMRAPRFRPYAWLSAFALLAACQGNVGSSYPSASLPQLSPNPGQYGAAALRQSRSVTANAQVKADDPSIEFPAVDGFGLSLILRDGVGGTASPGPAASGATPRGSGAPASAPPAPSATPGPARSATPSPASSATLSPAPSASASGAPPKGATPSPSPASTTPGVKVEAKLTTFPDGAPELTAAAGSAPRRALVKGYVVAQRDLAVRGPSAFEFILPPNERTGDRGFTIAVYESLKRNRLKLIAQDPGGVLAGERVRSGADPSAAPLLLHRGRGYIAILYASDLVPTPAPPGTFPNGGAGGRFSPVPGTLPSPGGSPPGASPSPPGATPRPTG